MLKHLLIGICLLLTGTQASAYDIFIDKKGDTTPEYIIQHADSLFHYTSRPGLSSGRYTIWVRITVENAAERSQFRYIAFDNPVIYKADFYYYQDSVLVHDQYGFGYPGKSKLEVTNIEEFRINVPGKGKKEIYVRIEPKYISLYSYEIKQLGEMILWKDQKFYATFIFDLFVTIILVFSIFLKRVFPDRKVYLAYILFLVSTLFTSTGMTGYYRPLADYINPVQLTEIFVTLSLFSCLYFLQIFFEMKKSYPKVDRILRYTNYYLLFTLLPQLFFFSYQVDYYVKHFVFIPGMLIFSWATFFLVSKKAKYAVPTASAFLISTLTSVTLNIAFLGFFRLGNWINYYQFSVVIIIITLLVISFLKARDKQVMEMASASLNRLITERTQALAKIGSWNLELPSRKLWVSDEVYRIYEMNNEGKEVNIDLLNNIIHPDEREKVLELFQQMGKEGQETRVEYRICLPDGSIKHIKSFWVIVRNEKNTPVQCTGYVQDITEEVLNQAERDAISHELLERNQLLQEFSYSVSHNLRSPLSNIMGLCELIEKYHADPDKVQQYSKMLGISSSRMDSILRDLNTLLSYDKQLNVLRSEFTLDDIAAEARDIYMLKGDYLGASFTWDFTSVGKVNLVKPYMSNIFQNMLSNSLKYSKPDIKPVIHFSGTKVENMLVLEFRDNGLGIDLSTSGSKLFGIYQRFNPMAAEGNGLGLYLIKLQVEKMKGSIDVNSEPGVGTVFTITIPI